MLLSRSWNRIDTGDRTRMVPLTLTQLISRKRCLFTVKYVYNEVVGYFLTYPFRRTMLSTFFQWRF